MRIPKKSTFYCSVLRRLLFFGTLSLAFSACTPADSVFQSTVPVQLKPWEAYLAALDSNGLAQTQMVKSWRTAGEMSLKDSVLITPPFQETAYFQAESPSAIAYQLNLKTGEVLQINLIAQPDSTLFFMDLFQIETTDSTSLYLHRFHAENYQTDSLAYEIPKSGTYVLRIQPELLVSCRYRLSLITQPVYGAFPVSGKENRDVWSFFGDPRDGGRRDHKGIDIFARRGTPVVAAVDGLIRSVRDKGLGGKQVWLYDKDRRQSLYYAHLDSQLVQEGALVKRGDTLGLVGNTGNARNTSPHLHFSIYRRGRGAIDPYPFIAYQDRQAPKISSDTSLLGQWMRVKRNQVKLRTEPQIRSTTLALLDRHLPLRILAAAKKWYRVQTPDGLEGYLPDDYLESVDRPIRKITLENIVELLPAPDSAGIPINAIQPEEEIAVIGRNGSYQLIQENSGMIGWMPISTE